MRHHSAAAISLGDRLKQTARNHGLDVNTYASRHVADRVTHLLSTALSVPFVVGGGLLFAQNVRETADADLVSVRRVTNAEFHRAMILIRPALAAEGITLHAVSDTPRVIELDGGKETDRWTLTASAGTLRGNTRVDCSSANGPDAFPQDVAWKEIPSLMKGGAVTRIRCQPLAAAAAEKFLAVILQPGTDYRVKHLADLVNSDLWEGVDCQSVAREIARTCRHRRIPAGIVVERPPTLTWTAMAPRDRAWQKQIDAGKTDMTFDQAWIDINGLWSDVHAELRLMPASEFHRPPFRPSLVERVMASTRPSAPTYNPF